MASSTIDSEIPISRSTQLSIPTSEICEPKSIDQVSGRLISFSEAAACARRRDSVGTTNSSPTDPAYVPNHQTSATTTSSPPNLTETREADTVPSNSEPTSFFDDSSDSDSSIHEDPLSEMGRASSVRISKPNIVQHSPFNVSLNTELYGNSPGKDKINSAAYPVSKNPDYTIRTYMSTAEEVSKIDSGCTQLKEKYRSIELAEDHSTALPESRSRYSHFEFSEEQQGSYDSTTASICATPTQIPVHTSRKHPANSNIVDEHTNLTSSSALGHREPLGLTRTLTSPLSVRNGGRHVTIRLSDIDTHKSYDNHPSLCESIVSTPYPIQTTHKTEESNHSELINSENEKSGRKAQDLIPQTATNKTLASEDVPSSKAEPLDILFLDLGLAKHPCAKITLEIQVWGRGLFDDEKLFRQIRTAYFRQLVGAYRSPFALIRVVNNATAMLPLSTRSNKFDTADFLRHFRAPQIGRKRQTWTLWLQGQSQPCRSQGAMWPNPGNEANFKNEVSQMDNANQPSIQALANPAVCVVYSSGSRTQIDAKNAVGKTKDNKLSSPVSNASRFNFTFTPSKIPWIPFAIKFSPEVSVQPKPCQTLVHRNTATIGSPQSVMISLHHGSSVIMTMFLVACTLFWSLSATTLWIIFGVPGTRPERTQEANGLVTAPDYVDLSSLGYQHVSTNWRKDAHVRVLTGLVLGLATLLFGVVVDLSIIYGGWLLL